MAKIDNLFVVGGGIQGLTIGYLAYKQNLVNKVIILEAADKLGGLASYEHIDVLDNLQNGKLQNGKLQGGKLQNGKLQDGKLHNSKLNGRKKELQDVSLQHDVLQYVSVDRFYHHYFKKDRFFLDLLKELGLQDFLLEVGFPVSYGGLGKDLSEKFLLGFLLLLPSHKFVENVPISRLFEVFKIKNNSSLVDLLKKKFSNKYKNLSSAWLWARLHARFSLVNAVKSLFVKKESLYFVKPSSEIFINALQDYILKNNGVIQNSYTVRTFSDIISAFDNTYSNLTNDAANTVNDVNDDTAKTQAEKLGGDKFNKKSNEKSKAHVQNAVVFTTPLPVTKNILVNNGQKSSNIIHKQIHKQLTSIAQNIPNVEYTGVVNLLVVLDKKCNTKISSYWNHLPDKFFPYVVLVAQHIVFKDLPFKLFYLGSYVTDFEKNYKQIIDFGKHNIPAILGLGAECKYKVIVTKSAYASHIPSVDFVKNIPDVYQGTVLLNNSKNKMHVFVSSFAQLFPWDRGVNYAVLQARQVVDKIKQL